MQRFLDCVEGVALLAAIALCSAAAIAAWRIAELAQTVDRSVPAVAQQLNATLAGAQQDAQSATSSIAAAATSVEASAAAVRGATAQIQSELRPIVGQVDLDLQETHRLILESALTASEARKASADERAALPAMTAKADASLDALSGELTELHTTTLDLDHLIDDPANVKTLQSLSAGSAALAQTAQDGERFVRGLLHPSWPHRVYHVGLDLVHALLDPF